MQFLVRHQPLCYHLFVSAGAVASHQIDVRIFPAFRGKASGPRLRLVAQQALEAGYGPTNVSLGLSLALADDETVQRLNRDYRGLDETTDVLAFAFHHPGHYEGEGEPPPIQEDDPFVATPQGEDFLGEVVISYPQCVRQAQSEGCEINEELALLVTHGVLHILGYDHLTPDEERVMREREAAALAAVGLHRRQT